MRWSDILRAALNNLLRRKLRSFLTMLGVVIGTAAIVVTISLGYGAEQTQMQALSEATNLMLVQVYPQYDYGSDTTGGRRVTKITDSVVADIKRMEGVSAATPIVNVWANMSFILKTGKYENYTMLTAVNPADFAKIQKLTSGTYFTGNTDRMEFIMSEMSLINFRNPKEQNDQWVDVYSLLYNGEELPLPDINWYNARYDLTLQWEDYVDYETTGETTTHTQEYRAKLTGIIEANINDWTFSNGAIVDINWLKRLYKENKDTFKDLGFAALDSYEMVYVLADSIDTVEDVVKQLNEYGVQYYSPMEAVATIKQQIQTMQGFLGFIGAVSMLVAALSIANTMMMSIYERTREIGVMKVLGCRLSNIRMLFLTEAAYIGLFGGGMGLLVSLGLSYALNNVAWLQSMVAGIMSNSIMFSSGTGSTSVIPPQLAWGTWLFVVAISLCSGLYPAYRAMRLSSLAAIRNAD